MHFVRISNRFFSIPVRRLQTICFHQHNSVFRQIRAPPARQQQSHQIPPQAHETKHLIKYWTIKIQSAKSCKILQKSAHFRQETLLFRQISTFSCKFPASFTHHPASLAPKAPLEGKAISYAAFELFKSQSFAPYSAGWTSSTSISSCAH